MAAKTVADGVADRNPLYNRTPGPQPKPFTAETAGSAEIRRKSKTGLDFRQKSSQATKVLMVRTTEEQLSGT